MPEMVLTNTAWKVFSRAGDTPIRESLDSVSRIATCQNLGIPSSGLDELRYLPLREGRRIFAIRPAWPERVTF